MREITMQASSPPPPPPHPRLPTKTGNERSKFNTKIYWVNVKKKISEEGQCYNWRDYNETSIIKKCRLKTAETVHLPPSRCPRLILGPQEGIKV